MKVLIVKLSSMGDVICTLPSLTDAKKALGDISFDWVVEENFVEIPNWHITVDTIIPIALRRWRKQLLHTTTFHEIKTFLGTLRKNTYDHIIDAQGLIKSAVVANIASGPSSGFSLNSAREPLASYLYQHKFAISKKIHTVERIRQLFAATLNYTVPITPPDYNITKEKLSQTNTISEKYLVFAHGASRENKCWPVEKWVELTRLAQLSGIKIKLPWGSIQELSRAKHIMELNSNVEILPKLTISEIGAILLGAQGVISVDTGFSHLAAALSIPTISLYGPTNPILGGTYGKNQTHLTNMETLDAQTVWQTIKNTFNV